MVFEKAVAFLYPLADGIVNERSGGGPIRASWQLTLRSGHAEKTSGKLDIG